MATKTAKKLSKKNFSLFFVHNYRIGGGQTDRLLMKNARFVLMKPASRPMKNNIHRRTHVEAPPETSDPHSLQNTG